MSSSHTPGDFMHMYIVRKEIGARHHRAMLTLGVVVSIVLIGIVASCNEGTTDPTGGLLDRALQSDAAPQNNIGLNHGSSTPGAFGDDTPDGEPAAGTFVAGRLLVKFKPGASENDKQHTLNAANARVTGEIAQIGVQILELPPNASETAQAKAFGQHEHIEFAELDPLTPPASITPNDPQYVSQWHLPKIGCPDAWVMTTGSSNVTIAIIDSGVEKTHPDLEFFPDGTPRFVPGYNTYDNNTDTSDVSGHGTAVAGQAAACGGNSRGVASPAWGCKIMPIRAWSPTGFFSGSTCAAGIVWAADHGARVANASTAMTGYSIIDTAAQHMQAHGGVVVFASGDNGMFDSRADDPYVLTVSATNSSDLVPSWSGIGNNIDLSAPGTSILTTYAGGGYAYGTGTSASAPIVAGVAALMLSVNLNLTAQDIQDILRQSADKAGPNTGVYAYNGSGWNQYYGYGRLNAARAVTMALPGACCVNTTCIPNLIQIDCQRRGGSWGGANSICLSSTCTQGQILTGACCFGTSCQNNWSASNCTSSGGSYKGDGTTCANVSCSDQTLPTCSITSPTAGSTVSGTIGVSANASDNIGVTLVSLYVDGALLGTDNLSPYSFSWNTTTYTNGTHTLQAKASDAAGNVGSSTSISVTVNNADTTLPTCSITSPTGGTVSGTVTVQVSASDNVSVTSVSLYVDGALLGTDNLSPYSFSWNTASYSNGTHTLQARASDAAGNVGSSTTISVTVNNTVADLLPPTVAITSPPNGATVNRTLSVYVSTYDAVGVTRVELYVDGVIKSTSTAAPFTTKWKTSGTARGAHSLQCRAYDARGNMGLSTVVTVYK